MSRRRRRVAILGSTGSIGRQTLEVIRALPDRLEVVGLAAGGFSDLFQEQLAEFRPVVSAVGCPTPEQMAVLPQSVLTGVEGLVEVATIPDVDVVMIATVGRAGLAPTLAAVSQGKSVALANKESLVMAGSLVTDRAKRTGARILPVDSEHSAIWQCLHGEGELGEWAGTVKSLWLTASGGALRDMSPADVERVSPARVLAHPTWHMGPKVTVDSASLMNKGLEVIEAGWLFGLPLDRIQIVLHRQSIVHSLVEFVDGALKAQLGTPDMRTPIQYSLTYPERLPGLAAPLDLAKAGALTFEDIDLARYPCLRLALEAAKNGGSYPAALSSANEVAVQLFLAEKIWFGDIPVLVEEVLSRHRPVQIDSLEAVLKVDEEARIECTNLARNRRRI
ncbi:MAG TPA: 1-deoxy-D-xylulose-5-phosphate reductoisomerase [Chloroflexota bacterium]|nr:1-deoxy-D-xylulose-5-phosphate reductoisomerase [Chloroflexota bacterium]